MTETKPARTCNGTTKAGNPCRSTAVADDGFCFVHGRSASLLPEVARRAGLASGEARREQAKSVRDRLRDKVEDNVERIWDAFDAGLNSDDERVRIATAQAVLAEAYGRPAQAIIGDADRPIAFHLISAFQAAVAVDETPELTS